MEGHVQVLTFQIIQNNKLIDKENYFLLQLLL
jgi:hypothetical protein